MEAFAALQNPTCIRIEAERGSSASYVRLMGSKGLHAIPDYHKKMLWTEGIIGTFCFKNEAGHNVTFITFGIPHKDMIKD